MKNLPKSPLFMSTSSKALALVAGLVILGGCTTASTYDTASVATKTVKSAKVAQEMVLSATTTNNKARSLYDDGWADFENARGVTAYKKFNAAANADPAFAMAHMMAAWTAPSTEGFTTHTNKASALKASAGPGEQQLITMLERFLANDAQGARDAAVTLTELRPKSPRAWDFLGATHSNINETGKARAAYKMATKLDASYVPGFVNLGNSYLSQEPKDFMRAEKYFKKAVALTPNEPNPHDLLGDVHRAQNNLKAAYKDYTKAAELAPDLGSGLQQRGHVNSFLGKYAEARADYEKAAVLEDARGSSAGPSFRVYGAYVNLHEGKPSAAITELQGISDSLIGSTKDGAQDARVFALYNIAQIATEAGRSETASKAIKEAATIQMKQAEALGSDDILSAAKATKLYYKGMLAARMGDSEKAMAKAAAFEQQVAGNSSPRKLERKHEILGMSAFKAGNYAKAAKHLAKGDTQANMATKFYLARALEESGNGAEAAKLYNEMAVYNFNGPGYAMHRKDILKRLAAS